jgi:hypothetical protein
MNTEQIRGTAYPDTHTQILKNFLILEPSQSYLESHEISSQPRNPLQGIKSSDDTSQVNFMTSSPTAVIGFH